MWFRIGREYWKKSKYLGINSNFYYSNNHTHEQRVLTLKILEINPDKKLNSKHKTNICLQEHQILKEERFQMDRLTALEKAERLRFSELSNAVRDSHEKERSQAEKTKYWWDMQQ